MARKMFSINSVVYAGCCIIYLTVPTDAVSLIGWEIHHYQDELMLTFFIILVAMVKLSYGHLPNSVTYIPESLMLIAIGAIFGYIKHNMKSGTIHKLTPTMFFNYLLPPIIIDSSFCLYHRVFAENILLILLIAVVGTILNFLIIGCSLYLVSLIPMFGISGLFISMQNILLFSSIIVAIDPVAVLVIFQELGVDEGLYYVVFGEALLNDAVTVVLYKLMSEFNVKTNVTASDIVIGILGFFTTSIGGFFMGIIIGALCTLLTRATYKMQYLEPLFIFAFSYLAYIAADLLQWSGIIAVIGCGLMQKAFALSNLGFHSEIASHSFASLAAAVSESLIFLFLGIELFSGILRKIHLPFAIWTVVLCLAVRTTVTFLLTGISNALHMSRERFTISQILIISWGGLRGAVSYSLAAAYTSQNHYHPFDDTIESTTMFVVLFTCIVFGGTIKPLVQCFGIPLKHENLILFNEINQFMMRHTVSSVEVLVNMFSINSAFESLNKFNKENLRKVFLTNPHQCDEHILKVFEEISMNEAFQYTHQSREKIMSRYSTIGGPNTFPSRLNRLVQSQESDYQRGYSRMVTAITVNSDETRSSVTMPHSTYRRFTPNRPEMNRFNLYASFTSKQSNDEQLHVTIMSPPEGKGLKPISEEQDSEHPDGRIEQKRCVSDNYRLDRFTSTETFIIGKASEELFKREIKEGHSGKVSGVEKHLQIVKEAPFKDSSTEEEKQNNVSYDDEKK